VLERVLKVRQVNLINLILEQRLVPEFLGRHCTPENLAAGLVQLIEDERVRAVHLRGYDETMQRLGSGDISPSLRAADQILAVIAAARREGEATPPPMGVHRP
jgi:lipid-A-disaccharide synthase